MFERSSEAVVLPFSLLSLFCCDEEDISSARRSSRWSSSCDMLYFESPGLVRFKSCRDHVGSGIHFKPEDDVLSFLSNDEKGRKTVEQAPPWNNLLQSRTVRSLEADTGGNIFNLEAVDLRRAKESCLVMLSCQVADFNCGEGFCLRRTTLD